MLEITGLHKTFFPGTHNEVRALRGVDLQIDPGSWVNVIGTNGSGKSTLLNAVAGAFPVDQGQILLDGNDITNWPEHRRAKLIGRVFQDPFSGTAPSMTIGQNLALASRRGRFRGLGFALKSKRRDELRERVAAMGLGLEDKIDKPMDTLSGGQRQSITLLMAGLVRPALLLLDEHTAALDPKSADKIIQLTEAFVSEYRLTTIMVTHSMHQAANYGDRVVMMHQGSIRHDFSGQAKKRLRAADLISKFDELRRSDQLDDSAAEMLRSQYV